MGSVAPIVGDDTRPAGRPVSEAVELVAGAKLGRYIIRRVLGKGGMGVVYDAWDPELDREVAVKQLRVAGAEQSDAAERLRREGRAVAKLTHPNVVTMYDVGTQDGSIFVAMELVDGSSLDHWIAKAHPWREVLRVFLQAGEGLAVAHASGMVHRDFKPANVLIGKDGRVRVTDFGLARFVHVSHDAATPPAMRRERLDQLATAQTIAPELTPGTESESATTAKLTQTGAVMGTPAYMPPEQFEGGDVGAASDQFSFAVSLYEALYGTRPFAGATFGALYASVSSGVVESPPAKTVVPAWVRQVLLRALRPDPKERFGSLEDMLAALRKDPDVLRRRVAYACIGSVAVIVGVVVAARVLAPKAPDRCSGAERGLAGTWDAEHAATLRTAFLATKRPWAADSADRLTHIFDEWARQWATSSEGSCRANERALQSAHVFDLRTACLENQRQQVQELVRVLEHADGSIVDSAVNAASALPPLAKCSDVEALQQVVPLPDDPGARARIAEARKQVAEVQAVFDTGQFKRAVELGEALRTNVEKLQYKPLEAEMLYQLGLAYRRVGKDEAAASAQEKADLAADAGRDDSLLADIRAERVDVVGSRLNRADQVRELAERARAALVRAGSPPATEAYLEHSLGLMAWRQGDYDGALEHYNRAVERFQATGHGDTPALATVESNIGITLREKGRYQEAEQQQRRALALAEKLFGKDHPKVATITQDLAATLGVQGRLAEAIPLQRAALAVREQALGPDSVNIGIDLVNLAESLRLAGEPKEALPLTERARTIFTAALGAEHAYVAFTFHNEGLTRASMGDYAAARTALKRGLELRKKAYGAVHPEVAASYVALAETERRAGVPAAAIGFANEALALLDTKNPADVVALGEALTNRGLAYFARGDAARASADLERAMTIFEKFPPSPLSLAETRAGLARTLLRLPHGDRKRAAQLIAQARETFEKEHATAELRELDAVRTSGLP